MRNTEIAHIWAQQEKAKGKCGSIFFEGTKIYSYGYHFLMAEFVTSPKGNKVVLYNPATYSNSTTRHQSYVRQAINVPMFYCVQSRNSNSWLFDEEVKRRIGHIETTLEEAAKARTRGESLLHSAIVQLRELSEFASEFDLELPAMAKAWIADIDNLLPPEKIAAIKEKAEKQRQAELKRKKEDIEKWLSHEKASISVNGEVFLRLSGENVETSLGAIVPAREAKLLYCLIKNEKPVHGFKIGYYTVNSYSSNVLTVGCHKLKHKEIERFVQSVNWTC